MITAFNIGTENNRLGPQGATGSTGATGSAGATGAMGSTGAQGNPGTPASLTIVPNVPSRTLNSVFQPSTTKLVRVGYDVDVSTSLSLTGGQEGRVRLLSDASNPPTTVRRVKSNGNSGALTIGLSLVQKITLGLDYDVPPGHYVKIETTNTTGTPTFALVGQSEVELSPT